MNQSDELQEQVENHSDFDEFDESIHRKVALKISDSVVISVFRHQLRYYEEYEYMSHVSKVIVKQAIGDFLDEISLFNMDFSYIYEHVDKGHPDLNWTEHSLNDSNPRASIAEKIQDQVEE